MGGCRCTYKNCTLRSNGVTHMFHYPVFDKVRCHQWLTNAQKLEFLNLKVSQLKNRVVCQHHFKDDNFMNFLKSKLRYDAVPTEDGPYCDASQLSGNKPTQDDPKLYTISLEDIENEYLTHNDKKANFSVKYGDFLTNCDLMDLDSMNLPNDKKHVITRIDKSLVEEQNDNILKDNIEQNNITSISTHDKNLHKIQLNDNTYTLEISELPIVFEGVQTNIMMPNVRVCSNPNVPNVPATSSSNVTHLSATVDAHKQNLTAITNANLPSVTAAPNAHEDKTKLINLIHNPKEIYRKTNTKNTIKEKKRITILNEQKISEHVPFPVKLEPVLPSTILPLPKRNFNLKIENKNNDSLNSSKCKSNIFAMGLPELVESNNMQEPGVMIEKGPSISVSDVPLYQSDGKEGETVNCGIMETNVKEIKVPQQRGQKNVMTRVNIKTSNNSLLKNKIPPERMAAIEEKRKFNMKLRDIIASCLDKLDDEEDKHYSSTQIKSNLEKNITKKVSSYLAKEPELPTIQDYTVAYLEARMKKMEDLLLNKIDQNTQRILELKQSFDPLPKKKATHTQTTAFREEIQKKHLYQEISKHLSPEANSLIYEELFINKYAQKLPDCSPTKKRKYR